MKPAAWLLVFVIPIGCGPSGSSVCPDDGDPLGPVCVERVKTAEEFVIITKEAGYLPGSDRITKFMAPAVDDPEVLPTLFQNLNRYSYHIEFLRLVFPDLFGELDPQGYLDLILKRETRQYYSGNLVRIEDLVEGTLFGFTVYTAASSAELLEAAEVKVVYEMIKEVFGAGKLVYTFDPPDAMARDKAQGWVDPGFPIYFY